MGKTTNTIVTALAVVVITFTACWALVKLMAFVGEVLQIYATPY